MQLPQFDVWARSIIRRSAKDIEQALEDAYNQGYYYGLNNGWAVEQDKDITSGESDA